MSKYVTYFGYFGWLALLWYVQRQMNDRVTVKERINDKTVTRYNWFFALLAAAPLIYLAATRGSIGDTVTYRKGFFTMPSSLSAIPSYMETISKDKAFYFMAAVIRSLIGFRPVIYFGIIAGMQLIMMTGCLRKYSTDLLTGLFVFVASTDYYSFIQNGMRQFCAVCIILCASRWLFERKYIPAIIAVIIASLFHQSALIMLPVIFIVQGEPWNKSTVAMLLLAVVIVFFVDQFTNILDNMLAETQYTNVVSDWQSWNDDGTNPLRVLVYCVPAVLSLVGLRFIREADDPVINVCTNMSVLSVGLYLVSMVTSGVFIGRLPIYVSIYANSILLPWEIEHMFTRKSAVYIQAVMIVMFLAFFYFQIHFSWRMV